MNEECEQCFFYHLCKGFKLPYYEGNDFVKQNIVEEIIKRA
jgi:hypothetical protein